MADFKTVERISAPVQNVTKSQEGSAAKLKTRDEGKTTEMIALAKKMSEMKEGQLDEEELSKHVSFLNSQLEVNNLSLRLFIKRDETHNRLVIQLRDEETGEVVRQFPPGEILTMYADVGATSGLAVNHVAK